MSKVSAVISAYNEEENIERCLKSLAFADEIIVVDNSSLDETAEIARKYTSKIYLQKNDPQLIDIQKNFGFEKASHEWILSIDADEEVTLDLAREIKDTLDQDSKTQDLRANVKGFWIPRRNIMFGKQIDHTGWYPDPQLRLFKKGMGKFIKTHVHEPIKIEGETGYLREHLIHHHYKTVKEFMHKTINIYAPSEAQNYLEKGYKFSFFDAIKFPLNEFLSRFFARKGYKDGYHGLMLSLLMAFYHFIIFAYLWEKQDFRKYDKDNFLKDTESEFKKAGKEIFFWFSKEKLDSIKNPLKKNLQRIKNKIRGPKV